MSGAGGGSSDTLRSHASRKLDEEKVEGLPRREFSSANDDDQANIVDWAPNDPENPFNWSTTRKTWVTFQLSMLALAGSVASAIVSPANPIIAKYLGVGKEVVILNVSLYVLGFALGPLLFGPLSEVFGRRVSILPATFLLGIFSIGTAVSQNAQSIFITRFLSGVFGSAPISNVSAALGDFWSREYRGIAMSFYSVAVCGGPTLAPVIGAGIITNPHLNWRWTSYVSAIWVFTVVVVTFFFLPEVYAPVLLKWRAEKLRKQTGNQQLWHPHEKIKLDVKSIITKQLSRPVMMLTTEPMVTAICFYASFVFANLYLTLAVFPIVFGEMRGWSTMTASLPFLGMFVGVLSSLIVSNGNQPRYARISREKGGRPVPEARCPPMAVGGVLFIIGTFLFAWTADPNYHWILPVIGTVFIGAGFNSIFQQCLNFLVDTYGLYGASATAANTFLRSILACGLPLAVRPMIDAIGVGPALSILGTVAVLLLPVPFLFMKYGQALRRMSKFAPVHGDE